jgi:sec-independent protein translocase protein TatA
LGVPILEGIGMPELIVIFVIAVLVFGSTRLSDLGKSLGEAIRGFKKTMAEPDRAGPERFDKSKKSGAPKS